MIEVRNLTKRYPGVTAIDGLDFEIPPGEIVGFLGPNGAGKSTTMKILTGYLAPTDGTATIEGLDVTRQSKDVRRLLGYLPETNPLYTEMRVREFLGFRAVLKEVPRRQRRGAVNDAVEACGLEEVADRIVGHLSKGYRQRVGLADAIVHRPQIVILDEPTIGLDPNQVRQVRALIRRLGERRTVILSTHILSEVEIMCQRVILIHRGRIRADGHYRDLIARHQVRHSVRLELRIADGRAVKERLEQVEGVGRVLWSDFGGLHRFVVEPQGREDLREPLYRLAVDRGWDLVELRPDTSVLEALFAALTQGEEAIA
jgi:ABC-2 type transport system ATP-binding protein